MDPARLAGAALDLNLSLMRWRAAPTLDTGALARTHCLLLGAGMTRPPWTFPGCKPVMVVPVHDCAWLHRRVHAVICCITGLVQSVV